MSKLGKRQITIPEGASVDFQDHIVKISGPKGSLLVPKMDKVEITISGNQINLQPADLLQQTRMNWGTMWSLINNALEGVTKEFSKSLEIEGIGFKAAVEGKDLVLKIGFSHPVRLPIPEGIKITVEKNEIVVSGIDRKLVGQTASDIRKQKKPEPYLGKGIRYKGEVIRRKTGKKAGTVTTK
ncbi:MAG: 50S ribosomal protein L6 [Parcubacteria group bacterium GW2011_GWB1_43_8b]|nr:MAG: 50S ribosomal protein L6 [Parcubacteria group bacterium GW2011_GWB1_43_8b]